MTESQDRTNPPGKAGGVRYSPVRVSKFVVLSILTLGLYNMVWFYRNWRWVKQEKDFFIWPWARALFSPIFYYSLLKRLDVRAPTGLALLYFLLLVLWQLPDPYSLLGSLSFLPLLPAVRTINERNSDPTVGRAYSWRKRSAVVAVLGSIGFPLVALSAFGPPTAVVSGEEMRERDWVFLEESGLLLEDEELLFFYSSGFLSIRGTGVFASNLGITTYWTDPIADELVSAFLPYEEIEEIEVQPSSHPLDETVVRVWGPEETWLLFSLSAEGGGDRRFLEEVEQQLTKKRRMLQDTSL